MTLGWLDWLIISGFILGSLGLGLVFSRRAGKSMNDYFISGRSLPWWLAGVSMIATAYSIDTPLGITGLVAGRGIPGVWFAWAAVLGGAGMLGAFIFAPLLRRSEVMTLAELIELRYAGRPALCLRLFKAVYIGILANCITMGWVLKAVLSVSHAVFPDRNPWLILAAILLFTMIYTVMAGMWGIAANDLVQYIISIVGAIILAIYAMREVNGIGGLIAGLSRRYGSVDAAERLRFFPPIGNEFFGTFIVFMTLKWWSDMPAAVAQRVFASKDERHASFATLAFAAVHFAINYWPMIIAGLVSLILYPDLKNPEDGYAKLMLSLLPTGMLGLLIASMLAAFMSTIDGHINMGASYLIRDIYQRGIYPHGSDRHYVRMSRLASLLLLALALLVAANLDSIKGAWYILSLLFAGHGLIAVARWFWWRINAWSEISALLASLLLSLLVERLFVPFCPWLKSFGYQFLFVFSGSSLIAIGVTLLTKPTEEAHLVAFCRKVKPFPLLWGPLVRQYPDIDWSPGLGLALGHFCLGAGMIYGLCFALGNLLFRQFGLALLCLFIALGCGLVIRRTWIPRANH
jgi:Na+/proline symporter